MSEYTSRLAPASRFPLVDFRVAGKLAVIAIFAAGALFRLFIAGNSDVSWDITVAEKLLAGARLYVDVIEVNPPATIYLYLPQTALAHMLSLKPEWVVDASVLLAAALSLWFSSRIVVKHYRLPVAGEMLVLLCAAFMLVILPARVFGEREHFALIAALPALAVLTLLADGGKVSSGIGIAAGIGAGLMAVIKPYLALGIVFAALAAAAKTRSIRPLFSLQNWMAALVCSVYVLWVWREFPAFFSEVVPLVADTYVSMRAPLGNLLFMSGLLIWWLSLPLLYWLARGDLSSATRLVPLAASCGFALAFLIQGKLWPYQSYPALAVCCFLLGVAFFERFHGASGPPDNRSPRLATNFLVALAIGASWLWFLLGLDVSGLAAPIRALKPNPKIISLSDDLGVGFPVTRDVGGEWVGRKPSLWVRTFADRVRRDADPAAAARLKAYVDAERKMFAEDVMRGRPDIILWQREPDANWPDWAKTEPGLAEALEVYRARETVDGVTILSRDETP